MNKVIGYLWLIWVIMQGPSLHGQSAELFKTGNIAYKAKEYTKAIESYTRVLDSGEVSAALYYNLGNAYYNTGQVPQAILQYERALKLSPSDKNILTNLKIANEELESAVIPIPDFILLRVWRGFAGLFSATVWVIVQFILGILCVLGIYWWRLGDSSTQKLNGFTLMLSTLALLLLSYFAGSTAHDMSEVQQSAIVLQDNKLRISPDDASEEIEALIPGVKVRILDQIDDWYQVSLANKEQGWIMKAGVEVI